MHARMLGWVVLALAMAVGPACLNDRVMARAGPEPVCGNGVLEGAEECDDGNTTNGDGCGGDCAVQSGWTCSGEPSVCQNEATCGNSVVEGGEECDGPELAGHTCISMGCSGGSLSCAADCTLDISGCTGCGGICGDGVIEGTESCDDGNVVSGDGCSDTCQVEPGWTCSGEPSVCINTCGNGTVEGAEECDTTDLAGHNCATIGCVGGTLDCWPDCTLNATGCTGCPDTCGDGTPDPWEECDDGNTTPGDGCGADCSIE